MQRRLLPVGSDNAAPRALEARVLGYKYGPLVMLCAAPFVPFGISAVVAALNIAACFGLFAAMYCVMRTVAGQPALATMGLIALLLDPSIRWNYVLLTATDVWPLLFSAIGLLYFCRGKLNACTILLAPAFCCKTFPSALFLPVLLKSRSFRSIALFSGVVTLIYAPWFLWDPIGVLDNVFLWPALMPKDFDILAVAALMQALSSPVWRFWQPERWLLSLLRMALPVARLPNQRHGQRSAAMPVSRGRTTGVTTCLGPSVQPSRTKSLPG